MQPSRPTYFADASLGHRLVRLLRVEGMDVLAHDDVFPQGTDDVIWLARAGEEGWVVLTKDQMIRKRPNELAAVLNARVRQFVLVDEGLTAAQMAEVLIRARKAMEQLLRRREAPFIATITKGGSVSKRVYGPRPEP